MNRAYKSLFDSFKWARNNTVELFESAHQNDILGYVPNYKNDHRKNRNVLYQFQCILTTTNTRIRRLRGDKNQKFGILITPQKTLQKTEIPYSLVNQILLSQVSELEQILKPLKDYKTDAMSQLSSFLCHEYLHQGQLVTMFREVGTPFPEGFDKSWDLSGQT